MLLFLGQRGSEVSSRSILTANRRLTSSRVARSVEQSGLSRVLLSGLQMRTVIPERRQM